MSSHTRDVKKHAKARQRRRLKAHERMARDRRQAQQAAKVLEQALHDLGDFQERLSYVKVSVLREPPRM